MTTTTTTRCDFCNAPQVPSEKDRWGQLIVGPLNGTSVKGLARDVCPVCIAKMRGTATNIPFPATSVAAGAPASSVYRLRRRT